jgi:hypothetical protein
MWHSFREKVVNVANGKMPAFGVTAFVGDD